MSDKVIIKKECTETRDIITMRPVDGKVKLYDQGKGIKRSVISITGDIGGASCDAFGEDCSGPAKIGTTETMYAGTPYVISTIRCFE